MIPQWISKFEFTEGALANLEEILAYSWTKFPSTAEQFASRTLAAWWTDGIYYRVNEALTIVEVLHYWHGSYHNPAF